ncbi:hypothetical protein VKT23_002955 [Stygiomarasmius scandens]|uniref:DUF6535 domain-containing protein n=1 Tax=Marasmiellus scandens TaxID=2682957 RepID=A0ABR1JY43_9AGAR
MAGFIERGIRKVLNFVRPRLGEHHPEVGNTSKNNDPIAKTKQDLAGTAVRFASGAAIGVARSDGADKLQSDMKTWAILRSSKVPPYRSKPDEDACSKLWAVYVDEAERYDGELMRGWKQDMEGLLIFSSLYSASLTAFIIESYKTLLQDPAETTVDLLTRISKQLEAASNGTTVVFEQPQNFQPSPSSVVCNMFWFLALALALTCSLLATFVQQWTRDFIHKTNMRPSPVVHARILMYSYFGMRRFGMHAVVDAIPLLLHLSLALFFAGLVLFLIPVNESLRHLMTAVLAIFVIVYLCFTLFPIICLDAPFRTPISGIIWSWGNKLGCWMQRLHGLRADEDLSLTESALGKSYISDLSEREPKAMEFALGSLTDDSELLPLLEAIPDVVYGSDGVRSANFPLITPYLISDSPTLNLVSHMSAFANNPSAWVDEKFSARCLTAFPRAIWSLAMVANVAASPHNRLPMQDDWLTSRAIISLRTFPYMIDVDIAEIWFDRVLVAKLNPFDPPNHSCASAAALAQLSQICSLKCRIAAIEAKSKQLLKGSAELESVEALSQYMRHSYFRLMQLTWTYHVLEDETWEGLDILQQGLQLGSELPHQAEVLSKSLDLSNKILKEAPIYIRGQYLENTIGFEPIDFYMLDETCSLFERVLLDWEVANVSVEDGDDDSIKRYLSQPLIRIAGIKYKDASSDKLFVRAVEHFCTDEEWAYSQNRKPVMVREIILDYFVKKTFQPTSVYRQSANHLEACIMAEFGRPQGNPDKYFPAIWLLLQCLDENNILYHYVRNRGLAKKIFSQIRDYKTLGEYAVKHRLYSLLRAFADGVVCVEFSLNLVKKENPSNDLSQCIQALAAELLHECDEFAFRSYLGTLILIAITNLVVECRVGEYQSLCSELFAWTLSMINSLALEDIDEANQVQFAESLRRTLSRNDTEVEGPKIDKAQFGFMNTLRRRDLTWKWLTSAKAADILVKILKEGRKAEPEIGDLPLFVRSKEIMKKKQGQEEGQSCQDLSTRE